MKGWERKFKEGDLVRFKKTEAIFKYKGIFKVIGIENNLVEIQSRHDGARQYNTKWFSKRLEYAYQLEFDLEIKE